MGLQGGVTDLTKITGSGGFKTVSLQFHLTQKSF